MSRDWVDDELWNWSRWANEGQWPGPLPVHCISAESKYSAPEWNAQPAIHPAINYHNAQIVERAWRKMLFGEKKVLQAEYLSPWNYGRFGRGAKNAAARKLRISLRMYELHLKSARDRVRREFD